MCLKLSSGNLNPGPYPLHSTSTYTCKVIIAPKICDGMKYFWNIDEITLTVFLTECQRIQIKVEEVDLEK